MGQNRLKNKNTSPERQAYDAAVKRWKDAEPKTTYGFLSSSSDKAALKQSTKYKNWLASKPPSFAEFKKLNQPAQRAKTSTKNVGQGTVLKRGLSKADTKKTVKKFDSIMRNAKGGKSGFGRKLLGKLKFSGSKPRTIMKGKSAYQVNRSRPTPKNK